MLSLSFDKSNLFEANWKCLSICTANPYDINELHLLT